MTKKQWLLLGVALVFAVLIIHHVAGWFKPEIIQVSYTQRPIMSRSQGALPAILFGFEGRSYRLSEIKVVPLDTWQTNHSVAPLWHLISKSRSASRDHFAYGENIPGMTPAVPGSRPEALEDRVVYRLLIRAGSAKGQCDFQLGGGRVTK